MYGPESESLGWRSSVSSPRPIKTSALPPLHRKLDNHLGTQISQSVRWVIHNTRLTCATPPSDTSPPMSSQGTSNPLCTLGYIIYTTLQLDIGHHTRQWDQDSSSSLHPQCLHRDPLTPMHLSKAQYLTQHNDSAYAPPPPPPLPIA